MGLLGNVAVNHEVGGHPVVVFSRDSNRLAIAFSRIEGGLTLTFDYDNDAEQFVDRETSSVAQ